jgi:TolA-binding protein
LIPLRTKVVVGLLVVGSLVVVWSRSKEPLTTAEVPSVTVPTVGVETMTPEESTPVPSVAGAVTAVPPEPRAPVAVVRAPEASDDLSLMNQLRAAQDSDPVLARQLAEEGMRRFPNSPDAAEREALGIKAYARQGRISEARAEAERMVNRYPGSKWALEVERHTGAHPIR